MTIFWYVNSQEQQGYFNGHPGVIKFAGLLLKS